MNNANPPSIGRNGTVKASRVTQPLPRPRNGLSKLLIALVAVVSITVSFLARGGDKPFTDAVGLLVGLPFPLLFLVEVIFRCLHAVEEYQHLFTRYENNFLSLIKDVFHFPSSVWIITICCTIVNLKHEECPFLLWYEMGPTSQLASLVSILCLSRLIKLQSGPLYDSLWIEYSNGLDYGSGMAHSFFHGYLKLIIPKTGSSEKNLEELMKDYEANCHVNLVCYKLFILIPRSLYCPTSLKNEQYWPSIEESTSLAPKKLTVAGVQNRVYKNSVYKIKARNEERIYVAAEYATPLKTFNDVINHNGEHSNYYKKYKNDIVLQFYSTLQNVLKEHVDCTNYCEPIYYEDKDEHGGYKDVGEVLLNRLRKLGMLPRA